MAEAKDQLSQPARILIVDDEPSVCRSMEKVLSRAGYRTMTALSASAALEALQADQRFDLIVTDLMMPQVNGIELLKITKTSWPDIRVLVVTGYATIASAVEATQLGAAYYLAKPFTPEELQAAVLQALAPRKAEPQEAVEYPGQPAVETDESSGLSDAEMVVGHWAEPALAADAPSVLVIDNEIVVCNSVRRILTRKGYRVEAAFTGHEALQQISRRSYSLVLMDMRLPDFDGLQLLSRMRDLRPDLAVLVVTGYASIPTAVEAIQRGAIDYMAKPFTPEELLQATARVMSKRTESGG